LSGQPVEQREQQVDPPPVYYDLDIIDDRS